MTSSDSFPATKRIGILVFEDFEPLDVWGFIEAFSISRFLGTSYSPPSAPSEPPGQEAPPFIRPFEIVFISTEESDATQSYCVPKPVHSFCGPRVAPDLFLDQSLSQSFDLVMVPGGYGVNRIFDDPAQLQAVLSWVRQMDEKAGIISSVCTGAALLAKAGVLDGKAATTNHQAFSWVMQFGPAVLWDNVSRWVDAGHCVTSAGVSAGTDMAFHLVARLAGRAVAENAVKAAEYDWHRDTQMPIFYPQQAKT